MVMVDRDMIDFSVGILGKNQRKILEKLEKGRRYTTREVINEVFDDEHGTKNLRVRVYSALAGLKSKNMIKSEFVETPYSRYRQYYKTKHARMKIRLWWIEK